MTKIETDIYNALLIQDGIEKVADENPITAHYCEVHAICAAEVARIYIEKALRDASSESFKNKQGLVMQKVQGYYVIQWLYENGVTGEVNS